MGADLHNVLMTADAVGGVWTYALDLARALTANGVRVTLATMGPQPRPDQLEAAAGIAGLDVITSQFALEWMDDPWVDVNAAGRWLLELEQAIAPDLIHLNGFAHGSLPWTAPVIVVGHSCLLSWSAAVPNNIEGAKLADYRQAAAAGLKAAAWVVAPTAAMLACLERHYGPFQRRSVIANGRRPDRFTPRRKEPFVFSAGRVWDGAKNVESLVAVARSLPWPIAVAGAEVFRGTTAPVRRPGVRFLGPLSEEQMADWLGRAAIFALPARYEPFGLLPLEAALSGCALVLGDIPSLREVWGDAADYVDPTDPEALRQAIIRLTSSPTEFQKGAAAARARALDYDADRMGARYLELYHAVLADHPIGMRCAL